MGKTLCQPGITSTVGRWDGAALRRADQLRYRWNGISKIAANRRAVSSEIGTASPRVTQNAGKPVGT